MAMPAWLADAVLYQIYPQSFADSNGDGIGDLNGIESKLDYLAWLGVNTVWLNPCFSSPMRDAGYDVADYYAIDPRYGSRDDLAKLVDSASRKGIRVLLDLVAGHTSDQHEWFVRSADDPSDDRYVWAAEQAPGFEPSPGRREGFYLPNFFPVQPALNFGYGRMNEAEPWRQPVDAPGPRANRQALRDIMDYWLRTGVAGFRVDMAASLVKDDPGKLETGALWRELRGWLDHAHPNAALFSEWTQPEVSVPAGFHADFFLHFGASQAFRSLFHNGAVYDPTFRPRPCYFDAAGAGSVSEFLAEWATAMTTIGDSGYIVLPTSNHDYPRLVAAARTAEQARAALTFILTWPTLPAIYYGDEIGMQYQPGLPDLEGSVLRLAHKGWNRAGSRTPMQWERTDPEVTYLPPDPSPTRPNVADQRSDPGSTLSLVKELIALRRSNPELGTTGTVRIINPGYPFVYRRGDRFTVAVNPAYQPAHTDIPVTGTRVLGEGVEVRDGVLSMAGESYAVFAD
ncbi:alpha-amylase family glycosyl hydrolase [Actinophytocola sp.]|uniref:alpha-amylase family glycosyl hydrolase n=1 Tax=Actinophytocola sp. TaxID=1872138 RepID=UPI002D607016|nr:alpha-amylase family glycosyl hydrolase [Actinophytocola sp.]HYQ66367.1 alpha-amylase family glycosyl hydrolase [Actinophytocola sp.]